MSRLFVELKIGEEVSIDRNRITLTLEKTRGRQRAVIKIEADNNVTIGKPIKNLTRPPK